MRTSADMPPRRRSVNRRRTLFIGGAAAIVVVFGLSSTIAAFYTDYLWFSDLGVSTVFTTVLGAKALLAAVFIAVAFALVYVNLVIAGRLAPSGPRRGPDDEVVERFREAIGDHLGKLKLGVAAVLALLLGGGARGRWQDYLQWRNRVSFGSVDPQFKKDVGFYVFDLPFRSFVVSWVIAALIATVIFTLAAHYLNGGIRLQSVQHRGASPAVKAHLSVLLAGVALGKAYGYWLERYELVFSDRGFARGAFYTDVTAKLPALGLLTLISVAAGALLIVNIQRRGFALPAVALGLWLFVSILVGGVYPALIQQFKVKPAESRLEAKYIQRNIDATRSAFGLGADKIELKGFDYTEAAGAVTPATLQGEAATIRNIRLWDPDPAITQQTFERLQSLRDYYQVLDIDIDRYPIDGAPTQVVAAVRELQPDKLPQDNWVNRHLQYTHGYGGIVAPANSATKDGFPAFSLRDLPPSPPLVEPRVYIGEQNAQGDYAIVNTKQPEIDFQKADGSNETSSYQGKRGIRLSSTTRRLAFALRFREINVMISSFVTTDSKVLYVRSIKERVAKVAPFLTLDNDPYPVVLDGKIKWVVDAYTTSDRFPYSQSVGGVPGGLSGVSYVRNSVKVTVDAYDGSVDLFIIDPTDPLVKSYAKSFPGLFKDKSKLPAGLDAHFRYPEDLFTLQAALYGRYHITDAASFFNATDRWNLSPDPGVSAVSRSTPAVTPGVPGAPIGNVVPTRRLSSGASNRIPAAYQLQKLPGDEKESFSILLPYVPFSKDNGRQQLTAFLTARSDPGEYGRLVLYRMPTGQQINGPALVDSNIKSDPTISAEVSLLNQQGSEVLFGNILLLPIEKSIIYIRPLYTQSTDNKLPKLVRVIAVYGNRAEMRPTLKEALTALFGDAPDTLEAGKDGAVTSTPGGQTTPPPPAQGGDVASLLSQADAAFNDAMNALKAGDLAGYQKKVDEAAALVRRAAAQSGAGGSTTSTTSASG